MRKVVFQNEVQISESRYVYDGSIMSQERDEANNVINEYTYGLGLPGGIGGLLNLNQLGVHHSYLYDGKGNVTTLLDGGTAQVAKTYQYDPFGRLMAVTGDPDLSQPMQFSTKPYDEKTGLSYYGYRFYVPALGRWLTRDPLGEEGGINLYGFVGNDPINNVDPLGLKWERQGWDRLAGWVCVCYWLCVPKNQCVIWGGNYHRLPDKTLGTMIHTGFGEGLKRGDNCLCPQPTSPCL